MCSNNRVNCPAGPRFAPHPTYRRLAPDSIREASLFPTQAHVRESLLTLADLVIFDTRSPMRRTPFNPFSSLV